MLLSRLKEQEGLRLFPYRCTKKKLTIGYGRNFEDNKFSVKEIELLKGRDLYKDGITIEIAEKLLDNDIKTAIKELGKYITNLSTIPEPIRDVLIEMMFNMGSYQFSKFKIFCKQINGNQFIKAGLNLRQTLYYKQLPKRVDYLVKVLIGSK